jgi:hypothetical protein
MQYLLPCECGRKIPVAASQAGETVVCECGRSLSAPKLRELRQLETQAVEEDRPGGRAWSPLQGGLFVAGAVVLLISICVLAYTELQRRSLMTEKPEFNPEFVQQHLAQIDSNTPAENLDVWRHEILEHGLERPGDPAYLVHREADEILTRRLMISGATAAVGLALIIAAFVIRPLPNQSAAGR